jgi:hypothetical protein
MNDGYQYFKKHNILALVGKANQMTKKLLTPKKTHTHTHIGTRVPLFPERLMES